MSEYWKSQPRKYCDFCKCWIAENKPSIDFHEKGKRHLENVKKRIDELKKKGLKDAEAKEKHDADLARMERNALEALKQDIANDPSLAAAYGVKIKVHTVENKPEGYCEDPPAEETTPGPSEEKTEDVATTANDWDEAKSPEGYTYYWNKVTGETTWTMPDGYIPPSEGKRKKKKKKKEVNVLSQQEEIISSQEGTGSSQDAVPTEEAKDTATNAGSEKTHNDGTPESSQQVSSEEKSEPPFKKPEEAVPVAASDNMTISTADIPLPNPQPVHRTPKPSRPSPYGGWETVTQVDEPLVDYELPKSNPYIHQGETETSKVDLSLPEEPRIKFREKRAVELPATSGRKPAIVFKKRKVGSGAANVRKRDDD